MAGRKFMGSAGHMPSLTAYGDGDAGDLLPLTVDGDGVLGTCCLSLWMVITSNCVLTLCT